MQGKIFFLAALALVQGRPPESENEVPLRNEDCPEDYQHFLLPHEDNCTKFYYCEYGMKYPTPRECAPGTHFSFNLQICDLPEKAGCVINNGNPGNNSENGKEGEEIGNDIVFDGENESIYEGVGSFVSNISGDIQNGGGVVEAIGLGQRSGKTSLLPNGCPSYHIHYLLPHENDCTKFYYCVYGEKVLRQCALGLHFNPTTENCDWPQDAKCTLTGSEGSNGNNNYGNKEDTNMKLEIGSDNTAWLENGCPASIHIHHLLSHESDCTKFYYCVRGEKVMRECAPGTHFNPTLQVCDWPQNAGCTSNGGGSGGDNGGEGTNWLPNGCPANIHIHHLLPHESDCTKFYHCVHGQKVIRDCAPGTHFNPTLQVCDWPRNAACISNIGNGGNGGSEGGNIGSDGGNGGENEGSGSNNGEENGGSVGGNGEGETTWLSNGCPANIHIHHLLPHESDCTKFYYCVRGEKVMRECAPGTHFNPFLQVCDWPQNAGCTVDGGNGGNGDSGNGGDTGGSGGGNDGGSSGGENGGSGDGNGAGGNGEGNGGGGITWLPNGCPNIHIHHLLPHESDCTKFYYCVYGQKVMRECAPGTHFNPSLQVCDWPKNAGCSSNGGNGGGGGSGGENGGSEGGNGGSGSDDGGENGGSGGSNSGGGTNWLPNGCPSNIHIHHLLPHENDCTKFYYCVRGEKVMRECPSGTHFNPTVQVCDWPQNAGCTANKDDDKEGENGNGDGGSDSGSEGGNNSGDNGGSEGDNNGGDNGGSEGGNNGGDNGGSEGDNNGGDNGGSEDGNNGGDNGGSDGGNNGGDNGGSEGDNNGGDNGGSEDGNNGGGNGGSDGGNNGGENGGTTWLPNGCPADIHIHHLLPHESDCAKFYQCVHGEKVLRDCAPGTHFNPILQVCDWPNKAGCDKNGADDKPKPNPNGNKCESGCNILPWAHETECSKFWVCDGTKPVLGTCSEGLHFNPQTYTCDFICNVSCIRKNIMSSVQPDGLKIFLPWNKVDPDLIKRYLKKK